MAEELEVCAAAYFRCSGKDVTTTEEFVMGASLQLNWWARPDAKPLRAHLGR